MRLILDTSVILALVREEKDGALLERLCGAIQSGSHQGFISSITIAEIYAVLSRTGEARRAAGATILLKEVGIQSIPLDDSIAKEAGILKGKYASLRGFSYADAAIASTALQVRADALLTYDTEFLQVKEVHAVVPGKFTL